MRERWKRLGESLRGDDIHPNISHDQPREAGADRPMPCTVVAEEAVHGANSHGPTDNGHGLAEEAAKIPIVTTLTVESTDAGKVAPRSRQGLQPATVPGLHCSICIIGPECPEYHEGMVCAFEDRFRDVPTRDVNEVTTLLAAIVEENVLRLRRSRLLEDVMLGGEVDEKTTRLSNQVFNQAKLLGELLQSRRKVTVESKGEGILSKIFGSVKNSPNNSIPGVVVSSETASLPDDTAQETLLHTPVSTPLVSNR